MSFTREQGPTGSSIQTGLSVSRDDELLSIKDLLVPLWHAKWFVIAVTLVFAIASGVVSLFVEKQYESTVIMAAVSEDSSTSKLGALGAIASQIGGLSSLIGGAASDRREEYLAILQSEGLTKTFIDREKLLPVLYAKKWDAAAGRWKETDKDQIPTLWKANQFFKKNVRSLSTDAKTGLSVLTIRWNDPQLAAKWANDLVALANDYIRAKAIRESERNIEYLNEQLAKSTVVAVQNSISALLESEIKQVMLARGSDEYAFRIIDAATPPERHSSPLAILWAIVGFLSGLVLSSAIVLLRPRRSSP